MPSGRGLMAMSKTDRAQVRPTDRDVGRIPRVEMTLALAFATIMAGCPKRVLTSIVSSNEEALGRPAGVAIDRISALLVADDVGSVIWRVTPIS